MENGKVHFRHVMQWEFKQGNKVKVTFDKICCIFGEGRITDMTVRKWFAKFRFGNMTLNGELGMGRLSEFYNNFLKAILEQRQVRDIADRIYASQLTACHHLKKLGKVFKLGVWVFYNLSKRNKEERMVIVTNLLLRVK